MISSSTATRSFQDRAVDFSKDEDDHQPSTTEEKYTPFIIDNKRMTSVPDEILIEIFQYSGSSPFQIVRISQVCKSWEEIVNTQYRVWQFVPLTISEKIIPNGRSEEIGHLLLKYFDRFSPVYVHNRKYAHIYKEFDLQYEKFIKQKVFFNQIKESEATSMLKVYKKPIIVCKNQFIEFVKHVRSEKASAKRLRSVRECFDGLAPRFEHYSLYSLLMMAGIITVDANISIGLFGRTPPERRTLDTGLWWLPYSMVPMHVLAGMTFSMISALFVNELFKFKSRSETGVILIFYAIWGLLVWVFTGFKYHMYNLAGYQLTDSQSKFFSTTTGVHMLPFYAIFAFMTILCYADLFHGKISLKKTFPFISKTFNWRDLDIHKIVLMICSVLSIISLIGFSSGNRLGPFWNLLPMIVSGIGGTLFVTADIAKNSFFDMEGLLAGMLPGAGAIGVAFLSLEKYSFYSLAPVTLSVGSIIGYQIYKHGKRLLTYN
ncbi:hypothetical protein C9374_013545 [Naegleria lovaniensis]|uniref:F-box domain-containing protein n=1 Tax=Naegleria lovaniensis TaxID=51637 RepID=A0AA88GW70_NAELO|nr:uncharacterized protein C9374_013545 [Naegleria lovaniensis]KAG2392060.1 hypothetical protein C9374_013545 [Naegleria lovaniensis]